MKAFCEKHGTGYEVSQGCLDCNALKAEAKKEEPAPLPIGKYIGMGVDYDKRFRLTSDRDKRIRPNDSAFLKKYGAPCVDDKADFTANLTRKASLIESGKGSDLPSQEPKANSNGGAFHNGALIDAHKYYAKLKDIPWTKGHLTTEPSAKAHWDAKLPAPAPGVFYFLHGEPTLPSTPGLYPTLILGEKLFSGMKTLLQRVSGGIGLTRNEHLTVLHALSLFHQKVKTKLKELDEAARDRGRG